MKKRRVLGASLIILGIAFLLDGKITGAVISTSIGSSVSFILGLVLLAGGIGLMLSGGEGGLEGMAIEDDLKKMGAPYALKKYDINWRSIVHDIEQEYLTLEAPEERTPIQKRIEKAITGGWRPIKDKPNKSATYEEQFYEGHASQGGRVLDVASHIPLKGKNKGKLVHFGQPANATYLWVVDEDGNFIAANRKTFLHEMPQMKKEKIDLSHRLHKLPHSTLARGKKVYGSGEVFIEGGKVKWFNAASGHYVDLKDIPGFNQQGKNVFEYFMKKVGWKEATGGAKYKTK